MLKKYPLFVFLLPIFFVLHGFTENYNFIPVKDAALLTGIYLVSSLIIFLLSRLLFKDWLKAALLTFFLLSFHLFFGAIHDGIRKWLPGSWISKYAFILPVSLCILLLLIFLLKKRKKPLNRTLFYLNSLLFLLIIIDIGWLASKAVSKTSTPSHPEGFVSCPECNKPDIYIIIADEYAGNTSLKDIFHFDNTSFESELSKRGFHTIPRSSSNYNYTPYSIASTLNMDYLDLNRTGKQPLLTYSYETIRNNRLLQFLKNHTYRFYNYSFFDFNGQPARTQETFLPAKTRLITSQTFLSRLNKELRFNLVTRLNSKKELKKYVYGNKYNNENLFQLTLNTVEEKITAPKFVLTHLMMPHYPYYYDKDGKEFPFETLVEGQQVNREHYVEYLQYSNKKLLELIDQILKKSPLPPLIILMSDHGFRHYNGRVDAKYYFSNFVSIHLPNKNYSTFTDTITNVNLMRTVLNTSFNQRLPYLKDTTIYMDNP